MNELKILKKRNDEFIYYTLLKSKQISKDGMEYYYTLNTIVKK